MSPLVGLDHLEVDRAALAADGGPFPTSCDGLPVVPDSGRLPAPEDGPVPLAGWREVDRSHPHQVVLAAPSAVRPRHWWLAVLDREGGGWRAHVSWPEPERRDRQARAEGLRLDWAAPELTLTAAQLSAVHVRIGRHHDDGSAVALDWDPDDGTHVVGHVLDTAGEPLEFAAHQAFSGWGPRPEPDREGRLWLPLRWTTYGVGTLPRGDYQVRAQLTSLPVHTPTVAVHVVAG